MNLIIIILETMYKKIWCQGFSRMFTFTLVFEIQFTRTKHFFHLYYNYIFKTNVNEIIIFLKLQLSPFIFFCLSSFFTFYYFARFYKESCCRHKHLSTVLLSTSRGVWIFFTSFQVYAQNIKIIIDCHWQQKLWLWMN